MAHKIRIKILLLIIIVFGILAYLLPPFIYNETEFEFRKAFSLAFFSLNKAEAAIQVRTSGPNDAVNYDELVAYGEGTEASIAQAIQYLESAQIQNNKQDKFIFLLPPRYREYQKRKISAVNEYAEITKQFLTRKQNEHMTTNMLMMVINAQESIRNLNDQDQFWVTMDNLPELIMTISNNSQKLKDSGYFDEDMYGYFIENRENFEFMQRQSQNVAKAGSWDVFDIEGLKKTTESQYDVDVVFANAQAKWAQATDAYYIKIEDNDNKLFDASNYYNENKLTYDTLSKIMSFFSDNFPRMKIIDNTQPTIIPSDINPDSVSFNSTGDNLVGAL